MAIADTITSMQTHTSNAYTMIGYGTDLTGINKNLANLKQCIFDSLINSMTTCENQTWNNLPKLTTTPGTTQSINNTIEAPMKIELGANELSQSATPTPGSPQAIHTITGENIIKVVGKNLFDKDSITRGYLVGRDNGSLGANASYGASDYIEVQVGENYTFSNFNYWYSAYYDENKTYVDHPTNTATITIPSGVKYIRTSVELVNLNIAQFEKGSKTTYETYKGNSYKINLGKNLLSNTEGITETINGITFTKNSDGSINANGTATDGINYYINGLTYTNIVAGTYTLSDGRNDESSTTYFTYLDGGPNNNSTINYPTFTLTQATNLRARIVVRSGVTLNNILFKVMVEKGSTATEYTPYFTPIELCKIGNYEDKLFKTTGKNLFDGLFRQGNTQSLTISNRIFSKNDVIASSGTYTISTNLDLTNYKYAINGSTTPHPTTNAYDSGWKSTSTFTFTTNQNLYIGIIVARQDGTTNLTPDEMNNFWWQIEEGSATTYEPYGKNEWWLKKAIGKVDLSTLTWTPTYNIGDGYSLNGTDGITNVKYASVNTEIIPAYAEKYIERQGSGLSGSTNRYKMAIDTAKVVVHLETGTIPSGLFYYPLATPTYTKINIVDLVYQLEAIRNSKSQNNQTNINQVNTDLAFILNTIVLEDLS